MAKTLRKKNQTHEKMVESAGFLSNRGARKNAYRKWTAANTAYSGTGAFMVHLWSKLVHLGGTKALPTAAIYGANWQRYGAW